MWVAAGAPVWCGSGWDRSPEDEAVASAEKSPHGHGRAGRGYVPSPERGFVPGTWVVVCRSGARRGSWVVARRLGAWRGSSPAGSARGVGRRPRVRRVAWVVVRWFGVRRGSSSAGSARDPGRRPPVRRVTQCAARRLGARTAPHLRCARDDAADGGLPHTVRPVGSAARTGARISGDQHRTSDGCRGRHGPPGRGRRQPLLPWPPGLFVPPPLPSELPGEGCCVCAEPAQ